MTKYTNNDQYETDKAKFIADIERFAGIQKMLHGTLEHHEAEELVNLLNQSKWIGSDFSIKPIPVVKDKHGKLVTDYKSSDWFRQLNEELDEIKIATVEGVFNDFVLNDKIAEELQDLITVCTSMLQWLGFDESKRNQLAMQVNEKNRSRGYLE